jgi:peptide-methionine (R)-S-oxide reductase
MGVDAKKTAAEWRSVLTPEQYRVLREKGTERAFSGAFWDAHDSARYLCAGCGQELFDSGAKFDSGTGWPSFTDVMANDAVELHEDKSFGMRRTEVNCASCGGHLGHVFDDGPGETGQRFCINSCSIQLDPKDAV